MTGRSLRLAAAQHRAMGPRKTGWAWAPVTLCTQEMNHRASAPAAASHSELPGKARASWAEGTPDGGCDSSPSIPPSAVLRSMGQGAKTKSPPKAAAPQDPQALGPESNHIELPAAPLCMTPQLTSEDCKTLLRSHPTTCMVYRPLGQ